MSANGSRPLRVAIIGSGPAGFYAAGQLLAAEEPAEVDMIERLPTPWGLVRLGVAPDHPKIKSVSRAFERIAERPGFRFLGNVEVGRDLHHSDLVRLYDAVIYAVGAQADRRLGIPGEDLPGSCAATELVAWYNGHPDFQELEVDLSVERAVVIGNGNVAVDVARMLALTPEELAPTDTTDAALAALGSSGIHDIVMIGRRGPAQAAWTTPELQELGELAGADVLVDAADLELDGASKASLAGDREAARNLDVLRGYATRASTGKSRTLRLRFLLSPLAIHGTGRVEAIEVVRNRLVADERGSVRAVPTNERETISCGLVFRSVGYRG
ncbi:MAG: FAD-dependent oxidoreductase, partial [Gaiellaceae bacterium]